jgi:hypothetical protein
MMAQMKANFIMLRIYWLCVLGVTAISFLTTVIVSLAMGTNDNAEVSLANLVSIFLLIMPIVIPTGTFANMINLGATRWEYYKGAVFFYTVWAVALSIVNVIWLQIEIHLWRKYIVTFNILEIFHWDQFGFFGSFLYQIVVFMLVMSLFHFLFSGLRSYVGWALWAVFIAAIPISTSIPALRMQLAEGLKILLFNDSLWLGVALNLIPICVFLLGGWLFTRKRFF